MAERDLIPTGTYYLAVERKLAAAEARITELEATNHRLTDALEAIAMMQTHEGCSIADEMRGRARAALAKE